MIVPAARPTVPVARPVHRWAREGVPCSNPTGDLDRMFKDAPDSTEPSGATTGRHAPAIWTHGRPAPPGCRHRSMDR